MRFVIPVKEFKNMKAPSDFEIERGIKRCYCQVAVSNLPDHIRNYILPHAEEGGPSEEQIMKWMDDSPSLFHLLSAPITIHADSFVFDNRKHKVIFEFKDNETQGIILGGKVLATLLEYRKPYSANTPDGEIYVELEFFKGLRKEEIEKIASLRTIN